MSSPSRSSNPETPPLLPERFFFGACLILLALTVLLSTGTYDSDLLLQIYRGSSAHFAPFWRFVSHMGSPWTLIGIVVVVGLFLLCRGLGQAALWLVSGWAMTALTVEILKWLIARKRPPLTFLITAHGSSFPSAHAAESLFVFFYLWLLLAGSSPGPKRSRLRTGARDVCSVVLAALPLLIGYSRNYLGVHWPSDVLGGWAIGFFILGIALLNTPRIEPALTAAHARGESSECLR